MLKRKVNISTEGLPLNWCSPKTSPFQSHVHGDGRQAIAPILKNEIVCVVGGFVLSKSQLLNFEFPDVGKHSMAITSDIFLCNPIKDPSQRILLNHSCEPNLFIEGQIVFRSSQEIKIGDELFIDYGTIVDEDATLIENCQCGQKNCRKVITGKDWKKKDLIEKYGDHFSSHILFMLKEFKAQ